MSCRAKVSRVFGRGVTQKLDSLLVDTSKKKKAKSAASRLDASITKIKLDTVSHISDIEIKISDELLLFVRLKLFHIPNKS